MNYEENLEVNESCESFDNCESSESPAPIEDSEYINFFSYLKTRAESMYALDLMEKFYTYFSIEIVLRVSSSNEQLDDNKLISDLRYAMIEILKDYTLKMDTEDSNILPIYILLKDGPEDYSEAGKKAYAEEIVVNFLPLFFELIRKDSDE